MPQALTNSKSLYECLVKLGITQEKRLMIDVMCLRQAYKRREIVKVKWIKGNSNLANAMTKLKSKSSNALKRLIDTNIYNQMWMNRSNAIKGIGIVYTWSIRGTLRNIQAYKNKYTSVLEGYRRIRDIQRIRTYYQGGYVQAYYTNTEGLGLIRQSTCVWEEIAFLSTF